MATEAAALATEYAGHRDATAGATGARGAEEGRIVGAIVGLVGAMVGTAEGSGVDSTSAPVILSEPPQVAPR